ncbi:MAG: chemotaxis protein CheC, partial [Clostridiales bacterium]|nr:chemotaxis protein CheC [Clostridiales bacterium]
MEKTSQVQDENSPLTLMESDAIGEILNISMGASATAISTLLSRTVNITTPTVSIVKSEEFECKSLEPAVGIEIEYIEGLSGSNYMGMKSRATRALVNVLLDSEEDIESEAELDEMHLSAVSEIMNQMMGASSTALATFFGKEVNISTPKHFDVNDVQKKLNTPDYNGYIVTVRFMLHIEDLLDSEFVTIMPIEFTKELVNNAFHLDEEENSPKAVETSPIPEPQRQQEVQPIPENMKQHIEPEPQITPVPQIAPTPQIAPSNDVHKNAPPVSVKPLMLQNFDDDVKTTSHQ